MEKKFYIASFSYKNLSLDERERFIKTGYKKMLNKYLKKNLIKGYISVETCLRIELYMEASEDFQIEMLQRDYNIENIKDYKGEEAIKYLLTVICGLDSIIKGEDQILVQLKNAYFDSLEKELCPHC